MKILLFSLSLISCAAMSADLMYDTKCKLDSSEVFEIYYTDGLYCDDGEKEHAVAIRSTDDSDMPAPATISLGTARNSVAGVRLSIKSMLGGKSTEFIKMVIAKGAGKSLMTRIENINEDGMPVYVTAKMTCVREVMYNMDCSK